VKRFLFLHEQRTVILLVVTIVMSNLATLQLAQAVAAESRVFYPYDSGIVYMLPSDAATPYWMQTYGDRTAFYIYSNISVHKDGILSDLEVISRYYRFIVRVLPLDDTSFFYYNSRLMDSWATQENLKILYAFFPKSKYGAEESYLVAGSAVHERLIQDMQFVGGLSSTIGVAVWYGWRDVPINVQQIADFYNSLSQDMKSLYCVWLDGSFVRDAAAAGLPKLVDPLNITVVTELYSTDILSQYGFAFKRQLIVSGASGAYSLDEWEAAMAEKLSSLHGSISLVNDSPRKLIVWAFWDKNDGSEEQYTAYLNRALSNPLLTSVPTQVFLDQTSPTSTRVNVGSVVWFKYHFSWPDGFNATNVFVNINGTKFHADANGWIAFTVSSNRIMKLILSPETVTWGPYELRVIARDEVPEVIFDRVLVELFAYPNPAEIGTNTTILAQGIYEYDGTPFQGNVVLNGTLDSTKPGTYKYAAAKIDDPSYGLTVFDSNVLTVTVYENPAKIANHVYLLGLFSAMLVTIGACFSIWLMRKRFNLKRRSIE
jgi:hypothetical protein